MVTTLSTAETLGVPRNVEAERSVLAAMLRDAPSIADVSQQLTAEDFYLPAHRLVYQAIVDAYDEKSHCDLVLLFEVLSRRGHLEEVGGRQSLMQLVGEVASAAGLEFHSQIVRDKAIQRQLIDVCRDVAEQAYHNSADARDLLELAEERVFKIARLNVAREIKPITTVLHETFQRIDFFRSNKGAATGLVTGYHDLDELTGGLQRGELIILAARPSMGKTSLALNLCERVADRNHGVMIFSMEMSAQQVISNMLCARAQVDGHAVRQGRLTDRQYSDLQTAAERLYDCAIHVDDTPGLTPTGVRAKCRRLAQQLQQSGKSLDMVVIDYLQLMSGGYRVESRQQEISQISRSLKGLARELDVPVIALSQLNRDVEGREDHRPRMSDLRESGAIEQDADVIALLHREEYYKRTEENAGLAQLILAKQRNGPTGDVTLRFFREYMRFEGYQKPHIPIS